MSLGLIVYISGVAFNCVLNGAIIKRRGVEKEITPGFAFTPLLSWYWTLMCLGIILTPEVKK